MIIDIQKENDLKTALSALDSIKETSSRNEKEAIIKRCKNNNFFTTLLHYTYNPFLLFDIKKKPKPKLNGNGVSLERYRTFIDLLDKLNQRKITGNDAKSEIVRFFDTCSEYEFNWYWAVMRKDLKMGATSKSIDKAIPNLIPMYECMLAQKFSEKKAPKKYIADVKLDGYRCNAHNHLEIEFKTRNGHPIEGFDKVMEAVSLLPKGYMYDGELMARTGSFNDMQSSAFKDGEEKDAVFYIFDAIPLDEFNDGKGGKSKLKLKDRLKFLDSLNDIIESSEYLSRIEYITLTNSPEDIEKLYEFHANNVEKGFEGTMVKNLDGYYECKRTYAIQKIKPTETLDLPIIEVQEGEIDGKYEGTLGALIVDYNGEKVGVGSGFKDAERDHIWKHRKEMINKMIEVKFANETTNRNGTNSLRHGIFKGFRPDLD